MKQRIILFTILGIMTALNIYAQSLSPEFDNIYEAIERKNYFKAEEIYASCRDSLSEIEQKFSEVVLDNAFNRLGDLERKIDSILEIKPELPDNLELHLYLIKGDSAVKTYQYGKAETAYSTVLKEYKEFLSEADLKDYGNTLKLVSALSHVPPQTIDIRADTVIKMKKDMAGSDTLEVSINNTSENFLFDICANFSSVPESVAERMQMKSLPVGISVDTSSGMIIQTHPAVCKKLTIGNMDVYNAVFLVVPDELMSFPDGYRINGLLGYPVIKAFQEVRLSQSGELTVKEQSSSVRGSSNMTMNDFLPMIKIDGKPYYLDTGGETTTFYQKYYLENKESIENEYEVGKVMIGGIGGFHEYDGFVIDESLTISGREVELNDVNLLKEQIGIEGMAYGNIGQDFIKQFDTMILNLEDSYIQFE